jgi:hypothetical protein
MAHIFRFLLILVLWVVPVGATRIYHPYLDPLWMLIVFVLLAGISAYIAGGGRMRTALWFIALFPIALFARWAAAVLAVLLILSFALSSSSRKRGT